MDRFALMDITELLHNELLSIESNRVELTKAERSAIGQIDAHLREFKRMDIKHYRWVCFKLFMLFLKGSKNFSPGKFPKIEAKFQKLGYVLINNTHKQIGKVGNE